MSIMSIPLALTLILIITLDVALPLPYGSLCAKVNKYPKPRPITLKKKITGNSLVVQ